MNTSEILQSSPVLLTVLAGIIGLMVGSFLNVVIYRLPVMMDRAWRKECREFLGIEDNDNEQGETFNLMLPLSRCPKCNSAITPLQNIPVFSYLLLKGKCAQCHTPISLRYPAIETLTGIASAVVVWHFGFQLTSLYALLLTWSLITLSFIDIDHQLLPDAIVLPLLWFGLFLSLFPCFADSDASIIGAIFGYLSLWSVFQLFKLLTGKEGMGYGDFKLLALFGAWLGWQYLPMIILLSSVVGAVIGVAMIVFSRHDRNTPIPFGPYIATAGWIALLWGDKINQLYLNAIGL